jgi:hypothetical protein
VRVYAAGATSALGGSPATGVAEEQWTSKFLEMRINDMKQRFPQFPALRLRAQQYADLAAKGDWRLETTTGRTGSQAPAP